jgi:hypothetical protein
VLHAEGGADVEQHRVPTMPCARWCTSSRRAAGRGDEAGPVAVVQRGVAADVIEAVELVDACAITM